MIRAGSWGSEQLPLDVTVLTDSARSEGAVGLFLGPVLLKEGVMSKKRHRIGKKASRRLFSKTASRTHKRNAASNNARIMRGGIRL